MKPIKIKAWGIIKNNRIQYMNETDYGDILAIYRTRKQAINESYETEQIIRVEIKEIKT